MPCVTVIDPFSGRTRRVCPQGKAHWGDLKAPFDTSRSPGAGAPVVMATIQGIGYPVQGHQPGPGDIYGGGYVGAAGPSTRPQPPVLPPPRRPKQKGPYACSWVVNHAGQTTKLQSCLYLKVQRDGSVYYTRRLNFGVSRIIPRRVIVMGVTASGGAITRSYRPAIQEVDTDANGVYIGALVSIRPRGFRRIDRIIVGGYSREKATFNVGIDHRVARGGRGRGRGRGAMGARVGRQPGLPHAPTRQDGLPHGTTRAKNGVGHRDDRHYWGAKELPITHYPVVEGHQPGPGDVYASVGHNVVSVGQLAHGNTRRGGLAHMPARAKV